MSTSVASMPPCARCAAVQRTCCQRAEILLTPGDVARIAAHTGTEGFAEHRAPADAEYVRPDPDDPHWLRYTVRADGRRRMLVRRDDRCTFLGARGCTLPLGVRPLVCRLYPFAYTEAGLQGIDGEFCPTALLAPHGEPMTDVLGMSRAAAERWRASLYEELRNGTP
jgi:Fe-S-cluster containining protein